MNLLVLSQYFWPETFRINDVVHGLRELGHKVEVLTGLPNYPEGRFFDDCGDDPAGTAAIAPLAGSRACLSNAVIVAYGSTICHNAGSENPLVLA
jgi:hypothetical protein